jgi:Coenzyme PQQ synthesis protein D (PqqD)
VTDDVRYARNTEILTGQSGADTFMMHAETGLYFALNETASRVWQILDQPRTQADIVSALVAEYRVDAARCQAEIGPFLADLVARDVLRTT